jgi:hypothetical protein
MRKGFTLEELREVFLFIMIIGMGWLISFMIIHLANL